MVNLLLSILSLILGTAAYSISQLQQHNKLKWQSISMGMDRSFWGINSWIRKYKDWPRDDKRAAFPGSKTWAIAFTDGYHLMQAIAMACLSLSFAFVTSDYRYGLGAWAITHIVHFFTYKLLSKK